MFGAQAGRIVGAGIGNDHQRLGVARDLHHRHRDAGVDSADHHVGFLAPDQTVHVVGRRFRFRFVIDLHERDFAAAELAALLFDIETETIVDELAELGVSAGVGQHQADLERRVLRDGRCAQPGRDGKRSSASRSGEQGPATDDQTTRHGIPPSLCFFS